VEAAFLLAGIEPRSVSKIKDDGSPQTEYYRDLKDALITKALTDHGSPTGKIGQTRVDPAVARRGTRLARCGAWWKFPPPFCQHFPTFQIECHVHHKGVPGAYCTR
jgi:hypothetical protein